MPVSMQALTMHSYYAPNGTVRIVRAPGDRYVLEDSVGMTAEQLATWFVAVGWARRTNGGRPVADSPAVRAAKAVRR